jgi:hypothetical protein
VITLNNDRQPCCAADALWRIRKIAVNGTPTGINRLDESIAAVRAMDLTGDDAIRTALMERVRASNYIPPAVEGAYADALLEEYCKAADKRCGCGCGGTR